MKKKNIKYINLIIATCLMFFVSCTEAEKFQDALFFTGTEITPTSIYAVDAQSVPDIGVTVSASCKVKNAVKIHVKPAPDLLESYNEEYGKNYKLLPEGSYELSSEKVTIKAKENVSNPVKLAILSMDNFEEGVTYCLPISISNVEGNLPVLESSRTIYMVLNQTIITKAASLSGGWSGLYFTVPFVDNDALKGVPQLSMETRLYVNKFQARNPYISTVMGIEENFLLRFGDVNIKPNQIQLAGGGFQVTGSTQFQTHKWYHVAVVYDGAEIKLYVNGKLDGSIAAPRGPIDLTDQWSGGFHVGMSCGGRTLDGVISEVRVWKRALTAQEVANNMCFVDNTYYDDLIAYWRFNEGQEVDKIKDWSGHGWDLNNTVNQWVEGVRCPE